ncbi:MAG: hypothetical protein E7350_01160 [Clostridiales bacterium]|nr:hypothetical protein [Clostridiales bacterium]
MIKKWRNGIIIYLVVTIVTAVMGYFFYASIQETNEQMAKLKDEGILVEAQMDKLSGITYTDEGSYKWGYVLPIEIDREYPFDGSTIKTYTKAEAEAMGNKVWVYYMFDGDGNLITYDKEYVDSFTPWKTSQSTVLWIVSALAFVVVLYFVGRNVFMVVVLRKGEESIGHFEEAFHSKMGSNKYYKVKYSFVRDGEEVTVTSPNIYDGRQVDNIKEFGTFRVRYIGKHSYIDQRF